MALRATACKALDVVAGKASKKGGKTGGRGRWSTLLRRRWVQRVGVLALVVLVGMPATFTLLYAVLPVPATPLMVARLFEGEGWSYDWVPREEISPSLGFAVIAAEDNLFCAHNGFDFDSLQAAWQEWQAGQGTRGASTISMQTAKNLYLLPVRSLLRKGIEAYLTVWLELLWPKRRILEVYLNIAQFGDRLFGAEAAARRYFGVAAADLSHGQAALLAAALPAPERYRVAPPTPFMRERQAWIESQMRQLGPGYLQALLAHGK